MYETEWKDKAATPTTVKEVISNLENSFFNTDCQLTVGKKQGSSLTIEFKVFNMSVEEAQEVFEVFERHIQSEFGHSSYSLSTDSTTAKATISL